MHFFINSIQFFKLLNWQKNLGDSDFLYLLRINPDLKVLTVSAILNHEDEGFKKFYAFIFIDIDLVVRSSVDEIAFDPALFFDKIVEKTTKSEQVEIEAGEDYNLNLHFLDIRGKTFLKYFVRYSYADLPPLPKQEKFDCELQLNKPFFSFVKIAKDYLIFQNRHVYTNSDTYTARYSFPDMKFTGVVAKKYLLYLSPGKYDLYVGKSYICLMSSENQLYCIPYQQGVIDSYKLVEALFNSDFEQSTVDVIPDVLGRKLGDSGFSVYRGNNLFKLVNGSVEFLFLDN